MDDTGGGGGEMGGGVDENDKEEGLITNTGERGKY